MIPTSTLFDQSTVMQLCEHDRVVQRYRRLFALFDWDVLPTRAAHLPGPHPHPESAYIKAFLVKLCEGKASVTHLRTYLVEHPLLVLELGFTPVLEPSAPYGFDVQRTLPGDRWLRHQQRTLSLDHLRLLLGRTVEALCEEIPGLGEPVAIDVKHIYAWVKETNPREYLTHRFKKEQQPTGDPDCRLGVKRSHNREHADGSTTASKECLWGYGSGVVAATTPDYGDVVLAEYTQPFNCADVSYYDVLVQCLLLYLPKRVAHLAADAAFDAWYIYEDYAEIGGIAAIPLKESPQRIYQRDTDGIPLCPKGWRMHRCASIHHPDGYLAHRYGCPILAQHPGMPEQCDHARFATGGCMTDINAERGGLLRLTLDRSSPLYRAIYCQRTSAERINSQAKELGIERPRVRNQCSVERLNILTYLLINAKALQRARQINQSLLAWE